MSLFGGERIKEIFVSQITIPQELQWVRSISSLCSPFLWFLNLWSWACWLSWQFENGGLRGGGVEGC